MKHMKNLKKKLLEQIKSSNGVPPKKSACDIEFNRAVDQFLQTEESLMRIQAAMTAWSGSLDAFCTTSQVLAEELAKHTMLVSRPSDPTQHGQGTDSDSTKFCRALQGLITALEQVATPVYQVFIDGALRPLVEVTSVELPEIHKVIEDRKKKMALFSSLRRKGSRNENANHDIVCQPGVVQGVPITTIPTPLPIPDGCSDLGFEERSLNEATRVCLDRLETFRTSRIQRIPEEIGVIVGCNYELYTRIANSIQQFVPAFPFVACTIVDIANASNFTKQRIQERKNKKLENNQNLKDDQERRLRRHFSSVSGSGKSVSSTTNRRSGKWIFPEEDMTNLQSTLTLNHHLLLSGNHGSSNTNPTCNNNANTKAQPDAITNTAVTNTSSNNTNNNGNTDQKHRSFLRRSRSGTRNSLSCRLSFGIKRSSRGNMTKQTLVHQDSLINDVFFDDEDTSSNQSQADEDEEDEETHPFVEKQFKTKRSKSKLKNTNKFLHESPSQVVDDENNQNTCNSIKGVVFKNKNRESISLHAQENRFDKEEQDDDDDVGEEDDDDEDEMVTDCDDGESSWSSSPTNRTTGSPRPQSGIYFPEVTCPSTTTVPIPPPPILITKQPTVGFATLHEQFRDL